MSDQTKSTDLGTAVVTGASSGIGKVYADRLAKRGYDLILVARRASRLEALTRDLTDQYGVDVQAIVADLGNAGELEKVAQSIGSNTSVTLLVNNAGTSQVGMLGDNDWANLEPMIHVNITALTRLTLAVLPGFKKRDRGAIVNIGSVVGFHSYPGASIYSGSKAFVLNFTQGLQGELAGTKITVQLVAPAATISEIWDKQGFPLESLDPATVMTTEDCVDAALEGLDLGEKITAPSLADSQLLTNFETAGSTLLGTAQTGKPAARYALSQA